MLLSVSTNLQSLKGWVWVPLMPPYWFKCLNIWFHNATFYSFTCSRIMNVIYVLVPRCFAWPHLAHSFFPWIGDGGSGLVGGGSLEEKGQQERARASHIRSWGAPVLNSRKRTTDVLHPFGWDYLMIDDDTGFGLWIQFLGLIVPICQNMRMYFHEFQTISQGVWLS